LATFDCQPSRPIGSTTRARGQAADDRQAGRVGQDPKQRHSHSQIGLTMNTCTHAPPEIEREVIDAVAKAIFE